MPSKGWSLHILDIRCLGKLTAFDDAFDDYQDIYATLICTRNWMYGFTYDDKDYGCVHDAGEEIHDILTHESEHAQSEA
ncbi:hypothetical protein K1719_037176 [Acacia pycnantha]|nr:hypothetical protein K1719_037176 [Acacia pycnantha]